MGYEVPRLPQSDPTKRQKGFILIDEVTHKVLPFREYRILNEDGETFRGVSDRFGFIPEFEDGMLEVVPSMGYYETLDIHEVADLWVDDEINQKQNNLSESSAVPASSKAKTIPDNQATSSGYITELRKKDTALAKKIDDMKFQGYTLDAVPDVPKGAKLVTIENLIKNTKGASSKQVEYVNWFSTDDSLYPVTETIIKEKHLKAEPHPKGCLTFGVRFSIG